MPFSGNLLIRVPTVVAFLCFSLITDVPSIDGKICGDIDVRNNARNLEKNLRGCTTIIGSLQIVLLEKSKPDDFANQTFPELREITGYLLLFRVYGLKTLSNLFPNLMIIRGDQLITHYALIIHELTNLVEIGLNSLIKVQHGYVMIKDCPLLCYVQTINWDSITQVHIGSGLGNYFGVSDSVGACPLKCPDMCPNNNCWTNKDCQLFDTGNSQKDPSITCHEECIGGCTNSTATGCTLCKHYRIINSGMCVKNCPNGLYQYDRFCVDAKYCLEKKKEPILGECRDSCPPIVIRSNGNLTKFDKCARECEAVEIDKLSTSDSLRGCQIVNGDIFIQLQSGVADTMQTLERNLGDIEEINGILKIFRSPAITSLSFFRSLRIITGVHFDNAPYTFIIVSNENLQELWNFNEKKSLELSRGNLLVHYNSKLCLDQINQLQTLLNTNKSSDYISHVSNGYEQTCSAISIVTECNNITNISAVISWNKINVNETQKIIGYIVYYIVAPSQNVTHLGIDTCAPYGWQSQFVQNNTFSTTIGNLTQNTQYAYYVKSQVVPKKHENDVLHISQGLSNIEYFVTTADVPSYPFVETLSKTNTSITLSWTPIDDNEVIDIYLVDIFIQPDEHEVLDTRDYCLNPKVETHETVGIQVSSIEVTYQNCNQEFEKWKMANPDSINPEFDWKIHRQTECAKQNSRKLQQNEEGSQILKYVNEDKTSKGCGDNKDCHEAHRISRQINEILPFNSNSNSNDKDRTDLGINHLRQQQFDKLQGTFENLQPYTLYVFQVFACNTFGCSPYFFHYDRTESSIYADEIPSLTITTDPYDTNQVHLEFPPPHKPNGLTVAFHIEKQDLSIFKVTKYCIPWRKYFENGKRFTFEHLEKGQYSFRVQSTSLASTGVYTDYHFINVYNKQYSIFAIVKVLFGCVVIVLVIGTMIIYFYRRYRRVTISDDIHGLSGLLAAAEADEAEQQQDEVPSLFGF